MKPRFRSAMVCYAVFAVLAALTLEYRLRAVVWIFLAGLAVKTWIAAAREREP